MNAITSNYSTAAYIAGKALFLSDNVLGAPVFEELLFRKGIQHQLLYKTAQSTLMSLLPSRADRIQQVFASHTFTAFRIAAASLFFGLAHIPSYTNPANCPWKTLSLYGAFWGLAFERYGIYASIALHSLSNLQASVVLLKHKNLLNKQMPQKSWERLDKVIERLRLIQNTTGTQCFDMPKISTQEFPRNT